LVEQLHKAGWLTPEKLKEEAAGEEPSGAETGE